jgi:hypothetical protein
MKSARLRAVLRHLRGLEWRFRVTEHTESGSCPTPFVSAYAGGALSALVTVAGGLPRVHWVAAPYRAGIGVVTAAARASLNLP